MPYSYGNSRLGRMRPRRHNGLYCQYVWHIGRILVSKKLWPENLQLLAAIVAVNAGEKLTSARGKLMRDRVLKIYCL